MKGSNKKAFYLETLKEVYISVGTNLGDRKKNIERALFWLKRLPAKIEKISSVFESQPLYYESSNLFYNLTVKIVTFLSPLALFLELKKIEFRLGRQKSAHLSDRIIDLDIVFYEEFVYNSSILQIPHPRALERAFVVLPLLEIEKDLKDPVSQRNLLEIKKEKARDFEKQRLKSLNITLNLD